MKNWLVIFISFIIVLSGFDMGFGNALRAIWELLIVIIIILIHRNNDPV